MTPSAPELADSQAEQGGLHQENSETDLDISEDYWLMGEHKQPNKLGHRSVTGPCSVNEVELRKRFSGRGSSGSEPRI